MNKICFRLLAAVILVCPFAQTHAVIECNLDSPGFQTSYDAAADSVIQTYVTVNCRRTDGTNDPVSLDFSIGADNGLNGTGGGTNRASMGTNRIRYDVYRDSLCGSEWEMRRTGRLPNPAPGTMVFSGTDWTTVNISYWGCVRAGQTGASSGIHDDTVTMWLFQGTSWTSIASASFGVHIHVNATCVISTAPGNITFSYASFGPVVNANTTFGATCTNLLPYTISLDATAGTLLGLNYSLALSASDSTGTGAEQTHTISGTMAAGQVGTCAAGGCSASQAHTLTITY